MSVIIPYHSRPSLLPRAVRSVLDQSHKHLEVIVVDGASEDDPRELLASFDDPRIVYIRQNIDRGVSASRNAGIAAAKGNYLAFLDDDDEWFPTKTEKQLAQLTVHDDAHKIIYCYTEAVSDTTGQTIEVKRFSKEGNILHAVLTGNGGSVLVNELMLLKEDVLSVGGFDERLPMHEDWDLMIRLAGKYDFTCVKEVLVRNHKHRLGHLGDRYRDVPMVRHLMLKTNEDVFRKDREALGLFYADLAYFEAVNGQKGKAVYSLTRSIASRPLNRDPYVKMALLLANKMHKPRTEW